MKISLTNLIDVVPHVQTIVVRNNGSSEFDNLPTKIVPGGLIAATLPLDLWARFIAKYKNWILSNGKIMHWEAQDFDEDSGGYVYSYDKEARILAARK